MLNFEAKEFSDLVATMGRVLSVNKNGDINKAVRPVTSSTQAESTIMTSKDRKVNEDFLQKSIQAVGQAVTRYIEALLGQGNGLNTTASISQLHNLSLFEGVMDIGSLLRVQREVFGASGDYEALVGSQFELGYSTIEALQNA